jgi:hypothetical protein
MNFRLFCILSLFIFNIIIHTCVEKSNTKIPDFRYTKTTCIGGYNSWSNGINDFQYSDINASPYLKNKNCWVYQNYIQFEQPYLSYEFIVFLDIFIFSIGYLFI